jgi:hypothetical protein
MEERPWVPAAGAVQCSSETMPMALCTAGGPLERHTRENGPGWVRPRGPEVPESRLRYAARPTTLHGPIERMSGRPAVHKTPESGTQSPHSAYGGTDTRGSVPCRRAPNRRRGRARRRTAIPRN